MKKRTIILSLLLVIGLFAACGSNSNQTPDINEANSASQQESSSNTIQDVTAPSTDDPTKDGPPEGFEFEVNLQTSLIVGSFNLEGTENEITTEQAAELLPLWMVLKNLLESDTSAMVEINALTNQIADTMTASQMSQINGMEISPESMRAMIQEMGLNEDPRAAAGGDGEETSGRGVNRPEGMAPGMRAGGGSGTGGEGLTPEQMESMQATREAGGGGAGRMGNMMGNTVLIDALIKLLQSK